MSAPRQPAADKPAQVVHYLSTLEFDDGWLARLAAVSPSVRVRQLPATTASDIPADVWRQTHVLHTSTVLPQPGAAPALRWVQLDTSGVDHVVDDPVWTTPTEITTIGGVSPRAMAEYVMFAVLGFAHRLPRIRTVTRTRSWPSSSERWRWFVPSRITGATMGIVGYGRIGREVGRHASAAGMRVLGVTRTGHSTPRPDSFPEPSAVPGGAEVVGPAALHDVLARSDYVVVVVPLTPSTRKLIDEDALRAVKPGAVLVNVARGGVVDEAALRAALRAGRLAGAVLDVFDEEPLPADSPWWDEPRVVVTPHIAGLAADYYEQVEAIVHQNLRRFLAGQPLLNRVDRLEWY